MNKEQIEVVRGGDNPFRDVGLPNPELENARATLAAEIIGILEETSQNERPPLSQGSGNIPASEMPTSRALLWIAW